MKALLSKGTKNSQVHWRNHEEIIQHNYILILVELLTFKIL